jgi:hypothetical protein
MYNGMVMNVGQIDGRSGYSKHNTSSSKSHLVIKDGNVSRTSRRQGIPLELTSQFWSEWDERGEAILSLIFIPNLENLPEGSTLSGGVKLSVSKQSFSRLAGNIVSNKFDVTCRPLSREDASTQIPPPPLDSFIFQTTICMKLVDSAYPSLDIRIEPRAILSNKLPLNIEIRSPMPHIFALYGSITESSGESTYELAPDSFLEVFTPGPSIAIMVKCSDMPVGGTATDWIEGGWVDIPLVPEFKLHEPICCLFPFVKKTHGSPTVSRGSEFYIVDGSKGLASLTLGAISGGSIRDGPPSNDTSAVELVAPGEVSDEWRSFYIAIRNYAVDHTGDVLFEQIESSDTTQMRRSLSSAESRRRSVQPKLSHPFGAYATSSFNGRISMLPGANVPIRLLHLSMEGEEGLRRSNPFYSEDISICDGGVDATPLAWEDGTLSGFFAYRKLVNSYQSEIHVVPEYIIFNGSESHCVRVKFGGNEVTVYPGTFSAIRKQQDDAAVISVEYTELGGRTPLIRIDSLGLRVAIVKLEDGTPIARVAIQTVIGGRDSRLVVKLGDIEKGALLVHPSDGLNGGGMIQNDFIRLRIRWSELKLTLNEARPLTGSQNAFMEAALDGLNKVVSPISTDSCTVADKKTWVQARQRQSGESIAAINRPLCTIIFHRFTVDWQRVFKDDAPVQQVSARVIQSPERSQLSIVIHHIQIKDDTPGSSFPIVFDSTSGASFFDLCVRTRGSIDADLVQVDLIDLNLAHRDGLSEKILISTSEEFVWKMLDVANRVLEAVAEFAGFQIQLTWDEEQECFNVNVCEQSSNIIASKSKYSPPKSDRLYNIRKTKVSPFTAVVSFRRNPQSSRYKLFEDVRGAPILNYFTRQLKFKIDKAELKFSRYEANNVKGPPDRVLELLSTVYFSRIQAKLVTIVTAASFQDWKYLASRDDGDDEFMDGDILRVTGNLAGRTVGYVLRQAGQGIGGGVSNAASAVGQGIENASATIGARFVGAGVNSVVSGVGEGVGDAVSGGKIIFSFSL